MMASPFLSPFDVVIPWVDFADPGYCAVFQRPPPPSPRGFTELRVLLRSLEQHGWFDEGLRDVVVLHSDHHPPPPFLRHDHPRLRFVTHAAMAPSSFLPLRSLEEITAWVHRVEGLTPWILFCEDDGLVQGPIDVFQRFAWRGGGLALSSTYTVIDEAMAGGSSWERGALAADRVLRAAHGPAPRYLDLHTPHLLHVPTLVDLARRWPRALDDERPAFNLVVLHDEHLLATRQAVRHPYERPVDGWRFTEELHTNSPELHPPATLRKAARLCLRLHRAEGRALFVNLQGPGISAEYDDRDAQAYGLIADAWLARAFPRPSMFERV